MGSQTNEPLVRRDNAASVATLTLNRPASRNALSLAMLEALGAHLDDLAVDPAVRVVVIAGEGPAFSAGHDLRELHTARYPRDSARVFARCSAVMQQIGALPQPVIAKVAGVATAAGCQLVATCDLAIAAESSRFSTPGVNIGLFCSTPGVAIGRALAPKHAMQMLLTGEMIDAHDAFRFGLVNEVAADDRLDSTTERWVSLLASKSGAVIAAGKAAYRRQMTMTVADAYEAASEAMVAGLGRPEASAGLAAFLDKRPPRW